MGNFIFDFSSASLDNFKLINTSNVLQSNVQVSNQSDFTTQTSPTFRTEKSNESMPTTPMLSSTKTTPTRFTEEKTASTTTGPSIMIQTPLPTLLLGQPVALWVIIALAVIVGILLLSGFAYMVHRKKTSKFFLFSIIDSHEKTVRSLDCLPVSLSFLFLFRISSQPSSDF